MDAEEAPSELHPLLKNDIDATPVYPIIHMIRQVRAPQLPKACSNH